MSSFKRWLMQRYLPAWAKETVYEENERLKKQLLKIQQENERLKSYIDGLQYGIKSHRRLVINTGGDNQ